MRGFSPAELGPQTMLARGLIRRNSSVGASSMRRLARRLPPGRSKPGCHGTRFPLEGAATAEIRLPFHPTRAPRPQHAHAPPSSLSRWSPTSRHLGDLSRLLSAKSLRAPQCVSKPSLPSRADRPDARRPIRRLLSESYSRARRPALQRGGFPPYWHQRVPPTTAAFPRPGRRACADSPGSA